MKKGLFTYVSGDQEFREPNATTTRLRYTILDPEFFERVFETDFIIGGDKYEAIHDIMLQIVSKYELYNKVLTYRNMDAYAAITEARIRSARARNSYTVAPYFSHHSSPTESLLPEVPAVVSDAMKLWDQLYFNQYYCVSPTFDLWDKVWVKETQKDDSLTVKMLHRESWYNRCYGFLEGKPNVYFSHTGLYTDGKIEKNMMKYDTDVRDIPGSAKCLERFIGPSIRYMNKINGWDKWHDAFAYDFKPVKIWDLALYGRTSSGLRPGREIQVTNMEHGTQTKIKFNGKKLDQFEYYASSFVNSCDKVLKSYQIGDPLKKFPDNHAACLITQKRYVFMCENRYNTPGGKEVEEERAKMRDKLRDFNILNMISNIGSTHLYKPFFSHGKRLGRDYDWF